MAHKRLKTVVLLLAMWLFQSCGQTAAPTEEDSSVEAAAETSLRALHEGDVEVVEIDGCEYLVYEKIDVHVHSRGFGFMAHKGNCKNPIHIYRDGPEEVKPKE